MYVQVKHSNNETIIKQKVFKYFLALVLKEKWILVKCKYLLSKHWRTTFLLTWHQTWFMHNSDNLQKSPLDTLLILIVIYWYYKERFSCIDCYISIFLTKIYEIWEKISAREKIFTKIIGVGISKYDVHWKNQEDFYIIFSKLQYWYI
jgi:hypothetical protein